MTAAPTPSNAVADRLIGAGYRPLVLGVVVVGSANLAGALFESLAHVSDGADGIDLTLPSELAPGERLAAADQLAEAAGVSVFLRSDVPMAGGEHTLILSLPAAHLRAGARVVYDIGFDLAEADQIGAAPVVASAAWPSIDDEGPLLVSTAGFSDLSDGALMGIASAASARRVAAVSTDRPRIVRRVVDTLAPLEPKPGPGTAERAGVTPCP